MGLRGIGLDDLEARTSVDRDTFADLRIDARLTSGAVVSRSFMRAHTAFDSFETFSEQSPWDLTGGRDPADVPEAELDAYVARTTEFETWEAFERQAATAALVERYLP